MFDFFKLHRFPEIALAKINSDAPLKSLLHWLWCDYGIGAVMNTAKVEIGSRASFWPWRYWIKCNSRFRLAGADQIVGVDLNSGKRPWLKNLV